MTTRPVPFRTVTWLYVLPAVLVPYVTLSLPFRRAMVVQATVLLVLTLGALGFGLARGGARGVRHAPRWLLSGILLYLGAALLGGVVGLLAGNSPRLLVGQLLSMGLLPLGALAGLTIEPRRAWRAFAVAYPAAVAVAILVHLAGWGLAVQRGEEIRRFILPNSVSLSGSVLLALLLALPWAATAGRWRLTAWTVLLLLVVGVIGSGTRGLWGTAALSWPLALLLGVGRGLRRAQIVAFTLLLAAAGAASLWGFHAWFERERPDLLPAREVRARFEVRQTGLPGGRPRGERVLAWGGPSPRRVRVGPFPVPGPGVYRLAARFGGGSEGQALVLVRWHDPRGQRLGSLGVTLEPADGWRTGSAVGSAPEGTTAAILELRSHTDASGTWFLRRARLERLAPPWAAPALSAASYLEGRVRSVVGLLDAEGWTEDLSIDTRVAENRVLLRRFGPAPAWRKLLGHGLGATFEVGPGTPSHAALDVTGRQNYVHNFYLFLLFKLGVFGAAAALAAIALWITGTVRCALGRAGVTSRSFLAAAASAWVGFSILAVSSPEILNFRMAPLLGWVLAATAGACTAGDEP